MYKLIPRVGLKLPYKILFKSHKIMYPYLRPILYIEQFLTTYIGAFVILVLDLFKKFNTPEY